MWSSLLVCLLAVGAIATQPGVPREEEHEPCCAPRYYTFKQVSTVTTTYGGSLSVELIQSEGAYDAKFERISLRVFLDFFNGTEVHLRAIADYMKGVTYLILERGETNICLVGQPRGRFDEECLDEDDKFLTESTLGDFDLVLDVWYDNVDDPNEHVIRSVQHEGCVPIGTLARSFDPDTGEEVSVTDTRVFDFNLGICDPDKYFKPPPECDEVLAIKEPTPEMLKFQRMHLFRNGIHA